MTRPILGRVKMETGLPLSQALAWDPINLKRTDTKYLCVEKATGDNDCTGELGEEQSSWSEPMRRRCL